MRASRRLAKLMGWLRNGCVPPPGPRIEAPEEHLLSSVEYELRQVSRAFRSVRLPEPSRASPLPKADPALFAAKLRHPANRKRPEWLAAKSLGDA